MAELKVIHYDDVTVEEFPGGAHYRKLITGESDEMPVVTGIQVSPPGYATPDHSHPYVEIVTVLEGEAEAWLETGSKTVSLGPGGTVLFPAKTRHGFRVVGEKPLKTYGVHISPNRIVEPHETS